MSIANYLVNINGVKQIDYDRDGIVEATTVKAKNIVIEEKLTVPNLTINGVPLTTNNGQISAGIDGILNEPTKIIISKNLELPKDTTAQKISVSSLILNNKDVENSLNQIDLNKSDIVGLKTDKEFTNNLITANTHSISNNLTKINTNTSDIITNKTNLNAKLVAISSNTNKSNINTTNIATNLSNINTLSLDFVSNATNISNNLTKINTNTSDITTNKTSINQLGDKLDNFTINSTNISVSKDFKIDDPVSGTNKISLEKSNGKIVSNSLETQNIISNSQTSNIITFSTLNQNKNGVITPIDFDSFITTNSNPPSTVSNEFISDTDNNKPLYIDGDNLKLSKHLNLKGDYGINNCKDLHFAGSSIVSYNTGNEIFNLTSGNGNSTLEFLTTKESKVKAKYLEGTEGKFDKIFLEGVELTHNQNNSTEIIEGNEYKIKAPTDTTFQSFLTYNNLEGLLFSKKMKINGNLSVIGHTTTNNIYGQNAMFSQNLSVSGNNTNLRQTSITGNLYVYGTDSLLSGNFNISNKLFTNNRGVSITGSRLVLKETDGFGVVEFGKNDQSILRGMLFRTFNSDNIHTDCFSIYHNINGLVECVSNGNHIINNNCIVRNELQVESTSHLKSVHINGVLTVSGSNILDSVNNLQTQIDNLGGELTNLQQSVYNSGGAGSGSGQNWWNPGGILNVSDDRLKHNEKPVINALDTINKLRLLEYDKTKEMKEEDFKGELKEGTFLKESGFIAQEVEKIPELKHLVDIGDEKTPYRLNYTGISCYAIQAIQELSKTVNELKAEIKILKNNNSNCITDECQSVKTAITI